MPSSVRSRSHTIGFFAFGFSENPASGSSFGNSTTPVSSEAIFIVPSSDRETLDGVGGEREAEAGLLRQDHVALVDRRGFLEQLQHPRHVFDRQPIRDRR